MTSQAGRWRPFILSALLHGALVAIIFVGGWWVTSDSTPPLPTLAIEATVVDAREIGGLPLSRPAPSAPPTAPIREPEPEPPRRRLPSATPRSSVKRNSRQNVKRRPKPNAKPKQRPNEKRQRQPRRRPSAKRLPRRRIDVSRPSVRRSCSVHSMPKRSVAMRHVWQGSAHNGRKPFRRACSARGYDRPAPKRGSTVSWW
jgi:outer membrane biosynthesis protein TonB